MDSSRLSSILRAIVAEDLGSGDVTTAFTPNRKITAAIIAQEDGFVSGIKEVKTLFKLYGVCAESKFTDGNKINRGDKILLLIGDSSKILSLCRSALNILSRMSGITTLTRKYSDELSQVSPKTRVLATRKTTPLFRYFEKEAVKAGGGVSHRMGLYDMVMIKQEHLQMFKGDVKKAIATAKKEDPNYEIEIEVRGIQDAVKAAGCTPDVIMLDNMTPEKIKSTLRKLDELGLRKRIKIEVSGGVGPNNFSQYAKLGVDYISLGELTHSPKSLDFSLKIM